MKSFFAFSQKILLQKMDLSPSCLFFFHACPTCPTLVECLCWPNLEWWNSPLENTRGYKQPLKESFKASFQTSITEIIAGTPKL